MGSIYGATTFRDHNEYAIEQSIPDKLCLQSRAAHC